MGRRGSGVKGITSLEVMALDKVMERGAEFVQSQPPSLRKKLKLMMRKLDCSASTDTAQSGQSFSLADHWMTRTSVERLEEINCPLVHDQYDPSLPTNHRALPPASRGFNIETVSYTHLTLPTKRIV